MAGLSPYTGDMHTDCYVVYYLKMHVVNKEFRHVENIEKNKQFVNANQNVINKKIDSCVFEQNKVRIIFKKNEGRTYIDLQELSSSFTFINKNELQKYSNFGLVTPENTCPVSVGTADTIISDIDEPLKQLLQYSIPEHLPESTTSTPYSTT
ncbi:hypothetical protein GLOIN_2v1849273 [Rhizophagus irregularis DAOM 181602=DAOM 197198]|uniref:Uncharacterized protein n=1 Tax=Rhizophagus irregularis (strain DAOM 181602 / DAOM 197198 / MUCL 43194) TaxID=747089 RepID=A0A2P4NPI2_RHIID|nr:hypothetical protein GLOIN_2v1849273 [Rhizophagus irregularis DAOM 181602=DAOM 197198]POG55039.1 hypothetical protein GLOIN_2v1849273 [Rhizophagus irregularis DAOM 181602=DAOM 197198]|eukprot:XP_025164253.1 hypothetical protein GLOIN_2v1849273 [Rhizophagus irregularis DAOM 181602=DAOM 197198]